jgi:ribose transport system ATP-binding protein
MPDDLILDMNGIWKSYPGVSVFEGFDFDLRKGEIHCICGENGAGKSTLIKILSGAHSPDRGTLYFEGKKVENLSPHSAMQMGIQTIYREHNLFPLLNVVENLFAGSEITAGLMINKGTMIAKAREILEYLMETGRGRANKPFQRRRTWVRRRFPSGPGLTSGAATRTSPSRSRRS